jgi:hypothetical protein
MSITAWERMAKGIADDPELKGLTDAQIEAIIDVLALAIHADRSVSPVEVAGFNHLFFDLAWLEGRHQLVRDHVPGAAKRAVAAGADPEAARSLITAAASVISSGALREKVFEMAVSLASVDTKVKPEEREVLRALADGFGIDEGRRTAIVDAIDT